jgi:hypothetical protein
MRFASILDPIVSIVLDGPGKLCVLGQEAVARVDRVDASPFRGVEDQHDVEVGVGRRVAREPDGGVGLAHVGEVGVGVGVDGHGLDAEPPAAAEDAAGDLGPVGHEESGDHGVYILKTP